MKKATTKTLYYEHSANNTVTMQVRSGEWFQVETQMNRGPDANLVPEEVRGLYNQYRSDNQPIEKGLTLINISEPPRQAEKSYAV